MTLVAHGTIGAALALPFTHNPWILAFMFILGACLDVSGYVDGLIRGPEYRWNGVYKKTHHPEGLWKLLYLIPPIGLHILIDKYCHKPEGGWNSTGYKAEYMFWLIVICLWIGQMRSS